MNRLNAIRLGIVILMLIGAQGSIVNGQDPGGGGGDGGGGVVIPPTDGGGGVTQPPTTGGGGGGGGQTANLGGDTDGQVNIDDAATLDFGNDFVDRRNQGFIGVTGNRILEYGFVGAASPATGPALADGASYGGGVNDQTRISVPTPGSRSLGQGGFQGASQNGFTVTRRNLRARVRPAFSAPLISADQTIDQFTDQLSRQLDAVNLSNRYTISVQDRTATVQGVVDSREDSDRIVRQLRLQPGVYKIVNQLKIGATQ